MERSLWRQRAALTAGFLALGISGRPMAVPGGGLIPPSPSSSAEDAFRRLISAPGLKPVAPSIPKFIKKLDAVPEIDLSVEHPIKIALALAECGLVG